jgi:hypothetical protein
MSLKTEEDGFIANEVKEEERTALRCLALSPPFSGGEWNISWGADQRSMSEVFPFLRFLVINFIY